MILTALALASAAAAQPPQPLADPEGVLIEALVVRARAPGPAWWRVSAGDSVVWVLGVPAALPEGAAWNDRLLKARLSGANELILPTQARVGPFKAIGFFLKHRRDLRSKVPLEASLPPELARRFVSVRTGLGRDAKRYQDWKPVVAALILSGDFRKTARLDPGEPLGHIRALARRAGVREHKAATYDAGPLLDALLTMSPQAHIQCLDDALVEMEPGAGRSASAATGWADGDVREALTAERGYERCFAAIPAVTRLIRSGHADTASAIAAALGRPGETVAVVELRALLAEDGVLDQLRRRGLKVETPAADAGV